MRGLMQDMPLTVDRLVDHAAKWHGTRAIVSRDADGRVTRTDYATLVSDAKRVSNALTKAGIRPGDRVATMGWNGGRHYAAWYGIAGMGAVCHTLNPRLFMEQIVYIADHADDRFLFADPACADPGISRAPPASRRGLAPPDATAGTARGRRSVRGAHRAAPATGHPPGPPSARQRCEACRAGGCTSRQGSQGRRA